ncbi:MAG: cadherin domain-containing protein [Chloroflexi bacterium]|nr:cadherin domain-containing protein [Chloroflexota bacterium]
MATFRLFSTIPGGANSEPQADSLEAILEQGLRLAGSSPVQLAFRGTPAADSVRCEWRGVARTPDQREASIRYWLGLDDTLVLPSPEIVESLFLAILDSAQPSYLESARASFRALAQGGVSDSFLFLACYVDYTVSEYILGAGPTKLTVAYDRLAETKSYELYARAHAAGEYGTEALLGAAEYAALQGKLVWEAEEELSAIVAGHESVVFVAPLGAHNAIAVEAWLVVDQWDLQTDDANTVHAVRYGTAAGDPEHSQTLSALRTRITTAAAADAHATTRIANASGLRAYYQTMGAYGDITPGDGETTTFTPAQPPAALTCAGGTAVSSPDENRALVHDCEVLLDHKAALAGTATLNWSATTAIASWEGVTTGGTPLRVTGLALASESLGGTIPAALGGLSALTTLDLSSNSLTGSIPSELGLLHNLTELRLSGNSLTGCVPVALKDVATNDLSSLSLLYCSPPAPARPTAATAAEGSVGLSWSAVTGASAYRVEYRLDRDEGWTEDSATVTGTTHTVDGLHCEDTYVFRVSARGSGTTYATGWSAPSVALRTATDDCTHPVFGAGSYAFTVFDDATIGDTVGTVTATDSGGDTLAYAISGGNEAGAFAIDGATGDITVAAALDHEATSSYTLTVTARDAPGGSASVDVTITVTEPPPCRTPTAADCIRAVYAGAPADYTDVSAIPVSALLAPASDGRYEVQRGRQYTVVTAAALPGGWTRFYLEVSPSDFPTTSGVSTYRLVPPAGTTYAFTVTTDTAGANLLTFELKAARPFIRPRPDRKPEIGPLVASTRFRVVPPAPASLTASLANGVFTLTWDAVAGADRYRLRYRAAAQDAWTDLTDAVATDTSASLTPATLSCGQTYAFEVEAHGDGHAYGAGWGATAAATAATRPCEPPVFAEAGYAFSVDEDSAAGTVVGRVEASSADGEGDVSLAITAGNTGGAFALASGSGEITVAGALRYATTALYTLTVTAADARGGPTATATVSVSVTPDCSVGSAVASPAANPGLVADCEALLEAKATLRGTASLNWGLDLPIGEWTGVSVSGTSPRVTLLSLRARQLTGSIPASLGRLTRLHTLDLSRNQLTGGIPPELGSLAHLIALDLRENQLTGPIPPELAQLTNLVILYLRSNTGLTGCIPPGLGVQPGGRSDLPSLGLPACTSTP